MSSLFCLSLLSVAFATPLSTSHYVSRPTHSGLNLAPLHAPSVAHHHNIINDSYIVVFKPDVPIAAFNSHFNFLKAAHSSDPLQAEDSGVNHIWDSVIKGYSGAFTPDVLDLIRSQPEVDYVEHDQIVHALDTQRSAPWGLARLSHRAKLSFGNFATYEFDKHAGEGVTAYVVDTGIYIDHDEFEGRARWGKTIPKDTDDTDGNGHGTHCAGTIGSRKFGVAKAANLVAVKVLGANGSGTMSDVVGGILWAGEDALKEKKAAEAELAATGKTKYKGSVGNMSLGGGKSRALDDAVNRVIATGMHFAVAAGNDNKDACDYSPASAESPITVGASTLSDERAYFSNHGPCVDVFAPGLNIHSTWNNGKTNKISGTSMASPHTAGLLAYLLSIYPSATFDPAVTGSLVPPAFSAPTSGMSLMALYARAHDFLPSWVTAIMPSPKLFVQEVFAPVPVLTPAQLKKAVIALASKDVLSTATLPKDTPNILIFNNATDAQGKSWWADL